MPPPCSRRCSAVRPAHTGRSRWRPRGWYGQTGRTPDQRGHATDTPPRVAPNLSLVTRLVGRPGVYIRPPHRCASRRQDTALCWPPLRAVVCPTAVCLQTSALDPLSQPNGTTAIGGSLRAVLAHCCCPMTDPPPPPGAPNGGRGAAAKFISHPCRIGHQALTPSHYDDRAQARIVATASLSGKRMPCHRGAPAGSP